MPFFQMSKLAIFSSMKKPVTRLYPFEARPDIEKTRGRIELQVETCTFCSLCAKKCPTGAIEMDRKASPRVFHLDRFKCILCGACVDGCASKSITTESHWAAPVDKRGVLTWTQTAPPPKATPAAPATPAPTA